MLTKDSSGASSCSLHRSIVANIILVPETYKNVARRPDFAPVRSFKAPLQEGLCSQATKDTSIDGMSFVRQLYSQRGVSESSANILCASWRNTTKFQYSGYIKKCLCFCDQREANPFQYDEINCLSLLTELFHMGRGYSSLNIARSALSTFLFSPSGITIDNAPPIKRFMKGVFELRPSLPRYTYIWDISIVLEFLSHNFLLRIFR